MKKMFLQTFIFNRNGYGFRLELVYILPEENR